MQVNVAVLPLCCRSRPGSRQPPPSSSHHEATIFGRTSDIHILLRKLHTSSGGIGRVVLLYCRVKFQLLATTAARDTLLTPYSSSGACTLADPSPPGQRHVHDEWTLV